LRSRKYVLKILVFEYITGGGLNKQALPDSLAQEGVLMLRALLSNLAEIENVKVVVMLDSRCFGLINTTGMDVILIHDQQDCMAEFERAAAYCDAVWPIAPESAGILENLCRSIAAQGVLLLSSPAAAVAVTGNKLKTYQRLFQHAIATVPTRLLLDNEAPQQGEWVIKPIDGIGCEGCQVISSTTDYQQLPPAGNMLIQPHIAGLKTSLSCLFKNGRAWLLAVNLQHLDILNRHYQLQAITVNYRAETDVYQALIVKLAQAFPELWGYVGIDLIETTEQVLVLEINPRLTSAFAGIQAALGINVGELVLQLLNGDPVVKSSCNQAVTLKLKASANG